METLYLIAQRLLSLVSRLASWAGVTYYAAYMILEANTIWLPICL
jgi:hypothetical protein